MTCAHKSILRAGVGTMVAILALGSGARLGDAIAREPSVHTVIMPIVPAPTCVSQSGVVVPCP